VSATGVVIKHQTGRILRLTVPLSLLACAGEVIE